MDTMLVLIVAGASAVPSYCARSQDLPTLSRTFRVVWCTAHTVDCERLFAGQWQPSGTPWVPLRPITLFVRRRTGLYLLLCVPCYAAAVVLFMRPGRWCGAVGFIVDGMSRSLSAAQAISGQDRRAGSALSADGVWLRQVISALM